MGFDGPWTRSSTRWRGATWGIGTPDDMIDDREAGGSGGFGGIMIQANEWATRE